MNATTKPVVSVTVIEVDDDDIEQDGSHWEPGPDDGELDLVLGAMVAP